MTLKSEICIDVVFLSIVTENHCQSLLLPFKLTKSPRKQSGRVMFIIIYFLKEKEYMKRKSR